MSEGVRGSFLSSRRGPRDPGVGHSRGTLMSCTHRTPRRGRVVCFRPVPSTVESTVPFSCNTRSMSVRTPDWGLGSRTSPSSRWGGSSLGRRHEPLGTCGSVHRSRGVG